MDERLSVPFVVFWSRMNERGAHSRSNPESDTENTWSSERVKVPENASGMAL